MPAVTSGRVLVTGASGFIATQLCGDLLKRGYTVVGTGELLYLVLCISAHTDVTCLPVRSDAKGEYLKELFKSDKFSYVIVADNEAVSHRP